MNRPTPAPQGSARPAQAPQGSAWPAVAVHGLDDAETALAPGLPVTLISATGAAGFAGVGWWLAVIKAARAAYPVSPCTDILDCAAAPGFAMAALRMGQRRLVLWPGPAFAAVSAAAATLGGEVLAARPNSLDLSRRGGRRDLAAYLAAPCRRSDP